VAFLRENITKALVFERKTAVEYLGIKNGREAGIFTRAGPNQVSG
jgi:hypothetical protein